MDNIIQFPTINKAPDQDQTFIDEYGEEWFNFGLVYTDKNEGRSFGLNLWARSQEDAERRIKLISETGYIEGQIFSIDDIDGEGHE